MIGCADVTASLKGRQKSANKRSLIIKAKKSSRILIFKV